MGLSQRRRGAATDGGDTGPAKALGAKPRRAGTLAKVLCTTFGVRQERGIMTSVHKGFRAGWPPSVGTVAALGTARFEMARGFLLPSLYRHRIAS